MAGERHELYLTALQAYEWLWATAFPAMSIPSESEFSEEESRGPKPWQSVRKAKVERARKLARDPNYPPKKVTDAIADLLARHVDKLKE